MVFFPNLAKGAMGKKAQEDLNALLSVKHLPAFWRPLSTLPEDDISGFNNVGFKSQ